MSPTTGIVNAVVDIATGRVKRFGYVDFASAPSFDPETELAITTDYVFDESVLERHYWYCESTGEITKGEAIVQTSRGQILAGLWSKITSIEQKNRLQSAMKEHPFLLPLMDARNWAAVRLEVWAAYQSGEITEADRDLLLGEIPEG